MLDQRSTVKVRSSGRAIMRGSSSGWGNAGRRGTFGGGRTKSTYEDNYDDIVPPSAAARRPGTPVRREPQFADDENVSQDAPVIAVGARVRHRKFGAGTIAELAGSGRELKAKVDFDDESVGRKTLVVAQANLEREIGA
jgi:DNA helicase-2/ATP-dependent DNA helicase PcrA